MPHCPPVCVQTGGQWGICFSRESRTQPDGLGYVNEQAFSLKTPKTQL